MESFEITTDRRRLILMVTPCILHYQNESNNIEKTDKFICLGVSESGKRKKQAEFRLDNTKNDKKNSLLFLRNDLMDAFRTKPTNHLSGFTLRTKLSTTLCLTKHSGI